MADDIVVIDQGRQIAQGSADELKATVGGERIEISLPAGADVDQACRVLARLSPDEIHVADRIVTAPVEGLIPSDVIVVN